MTTAERTIGASATTDRTIATVRSWTLIALVTFLVSLALWIGFLTVGGVFFTLSDGIALFMAGSMIPVMIGYDTLLRPSAGRLSRTARWIGLAGMAIASAGSIVLLAGDVAHDFVPAGGGLGMQFLGFGLEGVWFLMLGAMVSRGGLLSKRVSRVAYLAGAGFALGVLGSPLGPDHPIVAIGGLASLVGFVLWAIWTRAELES